ncbi:hypothetical protein ES703_80443 [subsurface metagenome]
MDWLREIFGVVEGLSVIRAIIGFILVFFLPGFAWTLVFFRGKQINVVERVALSFGLSIAVVTISIFALNLLVGVEITGFNSVLIIVAVTIIPVVAYYLSKLVRRRLR